MVGARAWRLSHFSLVLVLAIALGEGVCNLLISPLKKSHEKIFGQLGERRQTTPRGVEDSSFSTLSRIHATSAVACVPLLQCWAWGVVSVHSAETRTSSDITTDDNIVPTSQPTVALGSRQIFHPSVTSPQKGLLLVTLTLTNHKLTQCEQLLYANMMHMNHMNPMLYFATTVPVADDTMPVDVKPILTDTIPEASDTTSDVTNSRSVSPAWSDVTSLSHVNSNIDYDCMHSRTGQLSANTMTDQNDRLDPFPKNRRGRAFRGIYVLCIAPSQDSVEFAL